MAKQIVKYVKVINGNVFVPGQGTLSNAFTLPPNNKTIDMVMTLEDKGVLLDIKGVKSSKVLVPFSNIECLELGPTLD